jgi:hypothetical protein
LTVIVMVPEVTVVDPAVTWAGLAAAVHAVSTVAGIVSVVVVGVGHGPTQVTG